MPVDSRRLKELFVAASELAAGERPAFLDRECGGDADLRLRLDGLLRAHDASDSYLREPAGAPPQATSVHEPPLTRPPVATAVYESSSVPGTVIADRYTLVEKIGEGGMGEVWVAKQTEPVKRKVALKVIKTGMDSRAVLTRFEQERQALALMDHPHIARVLDGGLTASGQPFFAMELVNGLPLTKFCDELKLTTRQRLELFVPICQAVQHAHQKGIVHRDLKPSNILVTLVDGKGVPKVIDFGVAKATSGKLTDQTLSTQFGAVIGTVEYMAPEQAGFAGHDVDTRADIYSLGVILYEVLTGLKPHDGQRLRQAAFDELIRIIREEEPSRPSTRLSTSGAVGSLAALRRTDPSRLTRLLRGELDWIVMKCLEKQRDRRYETANGLARDIQRFLSDEVVEARPPSAGYRVRKFVHRHRGQVVAGGIVLLALLAGIAGSTIGLVRAQQGRREAERARLAEAEQRQVAETNEHAARRAAEAERAALVRESTQRIQAERARDRTRDVLNAMTSSVTEESLTTQQEISDEQKKFLTDVLSYYQELASDQADDQPSRALNASAALRVGQIERRLGRSEHSLAALRQASATFEKLAADFPESPEYRRNLAACHWHLGVTSRDLGKVNDWEQELRQALSIQELLAREFPDVPDYRSQLALTLNSLGNFYNNQNRATEAVQAYRASVSVHEQLVRDWPDNPEFVVGLAKSQTNLAPQESTSVATKLLQAAIKSMAELRAKFPRHPDYRFEHARAMATLATENTDRGEYASASQLFPPVIVTLQELANDFPTVPKYTNYLALCYTNSGRLFDKLDRPQAAVSHFLKAESILEDLVKLHPTDQVYSLVLCQTFQTHGIFFRRRGQANDSLVWFDKSIRLATTVHERARDSVLAAKRLQEGYAGRAEAYDLLERYTEAASDWAKAVELSPFEEQTGKRIALARALVRSGKTVESEAEIATLIRLWEERTQAHPGDAPVAAGMAQAVQEVGAMYLWLHLYPPSIGWSERATRLWADYDQRWPNSPNVPNALRWTHWNRSVALHWQGRAADAIAALDTSLKYTPLAEQPDPVMLRTRYVAKSGDHRTAAARISELLIFPPTDASARWIYWHAGLAYALCYQAAEGDDALRLEYEQLALQMLQQAADLGVGYDPFRTEPDLAPLRDREAFQKLLATVKSAQP